MATVKELKATARPKSGKGAARAERRAGKVPGVIYGNNQPPLTISVDDRRTAPAHPGRPVPHHDLRHRSRGQEAPRDSARLPSRSGARFSVPCRLHAARRRRDHPRQRSPARQERGSSTRRQARRHRQHRHPHHRPECSVDNIPQYIEADVSGLEISHSLHLSDIKLPAGVKSLSREDVTLVTIVPPSGYAEEHEGGCGCRGCGCRCAGGCRRSGCSRCGSGGRRACRGCRCARGRGCCGCSRGGCEGACGRRQGARRWRRQEEVIGRGMPRHATLCWPRQSRREIRA